MSKPNYGLQKAVGKLSYQNKKLEEKITRILERTKKKRDKKPQPKITRLVDRKDPWFTPSYHDEMQELARQEEREEYLPEDVEHV